MGRQHNNDELVNIYKGIGEQGVAACASGEWPRSRYFLSHCVSTEDGSLVPRTFDTDPVVGFNALLCDEPAHLALLRSAQGVFKAFVDDIAFNAIAPERRDELAKGVYWCQSRGWHTVVAIFQENPSLLPEADREQWRAVSTEAVERLGEALASSLASSPVPELRIQLHGYRVCADGAMIAVFVEADDGEDGGDDGDDDDDGGGGGGGFMPLRERAKEVGTVALGGLTSRPKKLIHVTMGRVLRLPEGTTDEELAAVNRVAERWASALLSGVMPTARNWDEESGVPPPSSSSSSSTTTTSLPCVGDTLRLSEVVLSTEQQWWMARYTIVARVPLVSASWGERTNTNKL